MTRPKAIVTYDDNGKPILKPCPVCGNEAAHFLGSRLNKEAVWCLTENCVSLYSDENGTAPEYWNYRASDVISELALTQARQEIERLKKALQTERSAANNFLSRLFDYGNKSAGQTLPMEIVQAVGRFEIERIKDKQND